MTKTNQQSAPKQLASLGWTEVVSFVAGVVMAITPLLTRTGSLTSWNYDSGVYFGASVRLVHGVLPYRDFVLLHPPGLTLLLSPISVLSYVIGTLPALALARILVITVMGLNCALVARSLRFRGSTASLVAGMVLALYPASASSDAGISLEPFLMLFCLVALNFAFNVGHLNSGKRVWWAGLAMGVAGTVKIWAFFPFLILAVAFVLSERRDGARFVGGAVIGFSAPCTLFFVASPIGFVRDIFVTQFARSASTIAAPGFSVRIPDMLTHILGPLVHKNSDATFAIAVLICICVPVLVFGARHITAFDLVIFFTVGATTISLLLPNVFYIYYIYYIEVFAAVAVGSMVGLARDTVQSEFSIGHRHVPIATALLCVMALLLGCWFIKNDWDYTSSISALQGATAPSQLISELVPNGACTISNNVFYLLASDRFSANSNGCPAIVDPYGVWLTEDPTHPSPGPAIEAPAAVAAWHQFLASAHYFLLQPGLDYMVPWTRGLRRWFDLHYVLIGKDGGLEVFFHRNV